MIGYHRERVKQRISRPNNEKLHRSGTTDEKSPLFDGYDNTIWSFQDITEYLGR